MNLTDQEMYVDFRMFLKVIVRDMMYLWVNTFRKDGDNRARF